MHRRLDPCARLPPPHVPQPSKRKMWDALSSEPLCTAAPGTAPAFLCYTATVGAPATTAQAQDSHGPTAAAC